MAGINKDGAFYVRAYDTANGYTVHIHNEMTAADICKDMAGRVGVNAQDAKFYSLVFVTTLFSSTKKCYIHYLRSLTARDMPLKVQATIIASIMAMKYRNPGDERKLLDSATWYYKDIRTTPISFNDGGEICAPPEITSHVSSHHSQQHHQQQEQQQQHIHEDVEDEEPLSSSDLTYLAKSDRKGYLLKRSSHDHHLWRRWYCVLMDHLWCVDITNDAPKAIRVKLSGELRYKEPHSLDGIRTIIIRASNRTHYFRCLNAQDQKRWIEELNLRNSLARENNLFGMAEFIMNDEECARSQRLHKQVIDVLDTPAAFAVLVQQEDYSEYRQSHLRVKISSQQQQQQQQQQQFLNSDGNFEEGDVRSVGSALMLEDELNSPVSTEATASVVSMGASLAATAASSTAASAASFSAPGSPQLRHTLSTNGSKHTVEQVTVPPLASEVAVATVSSSSELLVQQRECSFGPSRMLQQLNLQEMFRRQSFLHHLHTENPTFADILLFSIDVQKFKELYRHDLFVPEVTRRSAALVIYYAYLLPQVQQIDEQMADTSLKLLATIMRNASSSHQSLLRCGLQRELSSRLSLSKQSSNRSNTMSQRYFASSSSIGGGLSAKSRSEGSLPFGRSTTNGHWQDATHYVVGRPQQQRQNSSGDRQCDGHVQAWGIDLVPIHAVFKELFAQYITSSVTHSAGLVSSSSSNGSSQDLLNNSYLQEKYGSASGSARGSSSSAAATTVSTATSRPYSLTRPEDVLAAAMAAMQSEKEESQVAGGSSSYWPFFTSSSAAANNSSSPKKPLVNQRFSSGTSASLSANQQLQQQATERAPALEVFDGVLSALLQVLNQ